MGTGTGMLAVATLKARAEIWRKAKDGSVEERLSAIEANIGYLRDDLRSAEKNIDDGIEEQRKSLREEEKARQKEDASIKEFLESVKAGGLNISLMGVVWLALGVILTTFPIELAALIN